VTELLGRSLQLDVFAGNQKFTYATPDDPDPYDIEFDVDLDETDNPNRATIIIHNLDQNEREFLESNHQGVEFYAGYQNDVGLILKGTTTNVVNRPQPLGWITEILVGEGDKEFNNTYFSRSYTAGVQYLVILKDLISEIGSPFEMDFADPFKILLRAKSYSGKIKEVLNDVTAAIGLEWSMQQGVLEIRQKGEPLPSAIANVASLTPTTGLLEYPELIERQSNLDDKDETKDETDQRIIGVRLYTYLDHRLRPGRLVNVFADTINVGITDLFDNPAPIDFSGQGVWRIDKARFFGDNQLGPFTTEAEAYVGVQAL
jgi:hypothetical protein